MSFALSALRPSEGPAGSDARFAALERLVDSGRYAVLSLDVFDTLVWRGVAAPTDVFFHLGAALRRRGALHGSSSLASFVRERIESESRARRLVASREVTLAAIWAEFPAGYLRGVAPGRVAALELRVERALVRVHDDVRALAERARARGLRVALVSDTYLSSAHLRALTGLDADVVLASCEHGLSKRLGLHRVLLERTGVPPARVLHVGDHPEADVEGPGALGIDAFLLRRFPADYADMVEREQPAVLARRGAIARFDEHGLTSLRGRAMHACATEHERWGAGVLGPVVAGFAGWVAARCAALGIGDALCLMREGRVLAATLAAEPGAPAAHECFVSRYVALRAALGPCDEDTLARFLTRPSPLRLARALDQLGLEAADVPDLDPDARLDPRAAAALARRIAGAPELRRRVVARSREVRRALLRHLAALVPLDRPGTVAVVDLGYRGTIQAALQRVFELEGLPVRTHGLYLVTNADVRETQAAGVAAEGWLAENGQPLALAHTFVRAPEVIEQCLMADCGTTLGHARDGTPVLDERRVPDDQRAEILEVQRGLERWTAQWAAHRARHGGPSPAAMRAWARAIVTRAIARPLPVERALFAHWSHDENFGSDAVRGLAEVADLHPWERAHLSAHQLASLPSGRLHWPFALAHELGPAFGEAVAALYLRAIGPEALDSGDPPRAMALYWDHGAGFRDDDADGLVYTSPARGRVWRRFTRTLRAGRLAAFALAVGARDEVVRLQGVRVRIAPEHGAARTLDLAHDALEAHGARRLHDRLYLIEAATGLWTARLDGIANFTGTIEIDAFFAIVGTD